MNDQFLAGPDSDEPDENPSPLAYRATLTASLTNMQAVFFRAKGQAFDGDTAGLQFITEDIMDLETQLHEIHQELQKIHGKGWESMLGIERENLELNRFFDHVRATAEYYDLEGFGDDPEPDEEIGGAIPLTSIPPSAVTSAIIANTSAASAQIAATHASLASISASTASGLPTQSQYDLLKAGYNSIKADLDVVKHEHLTTSITATAKLGYLTHTICSDYNSARKVGWTWITAAVLSFIMCVWVTHVSGWGYGTASTLFVATCCLLSGLASFYTSSLKLKALASAKEATDKFQSVTDHLTKELGI